MDTLASLKRANLVPLGSLQCIMVSANMLLVKGSCIMHTCVTVSALAACPGLGESLGGGCRSGTMADAGICAISARLRRLQPAALIQQRGPADG